MTSLFNAVNNNATTANGAATIKSSNNSLVDLFFIIGASRGKDIRETFRKAYAADKTLATRILLWARDARGGAGERQTFIDLTKYLAGFDKNLASRVLIRVPELGRWKDLVSFFDTDLKDEAMSLIAVALANGDGLCAKWMPRKGPQAAMLRRFLELDARSYRKLLVSMTNVVESKMCAKDWNSIEFGKLPSLASARYQKAFGRNAGEAYTAYINALEKGEAKINAGAVYPYDVLKSVTSGNQAVANAQWKALPDYCEGSTENVLPVIDVSGSMGVSAGGSSVTCMDVAISLGLYISEHMHGKFKDQFISFSQTPRMHQVSGSLSERIRQIRRADWGYNTNLQAVFDLVLSSAVKNRVSESEMPTKILILSDMEFDTACGRSSYSRNSPTNYQEIDRKYAESGYKRPDIVFWNLNAREGNCPVTAGEAGTALVSGFSPSLMRSILSGKNVTPFDIMMETIGKERYEF